MRVDVLKLDAAGVLIRTRDVPLSETFGRLLRSLGRISTCSRHTKVGIFILWGKGVLLHYFSMQMVLSAVVVI